MAANVITLFSGYDSQCLALDRLKRHNPQFDYDLVAWSEIDPHAIKAHNALFPQWADRNLGDVSKVDWQQFTTMINEPIDLLTYSSPCQDFSSAGLQAGGTKGSGTRSSLLWECERAIEQLRPKYLLFENVSALVNEKFRPTFFKWCLTLEQLGYTNHYQLMNAKDYGVPQNRLRVFMVSVLDCSQAYYFPKPFPLEKRLKDVLETNVPDRYYLSQERLAGLKLSNEKEKEAGRGFEFAPKSADSVGTNAVCTNAGGRKTDNFLQDPCVETVGQYDSSQNSHIIDPNGISQAVINGHKDGTPKITIPCVEIVADLTSEFAIRR